MTRARILIAAQNASTRFGGEAILPLHYFRILRARGADVELVTHERNRDDLAAFFGGDLTGIHLCPDTALHRALWSVGRRVPAAIRAATTDPLMALATDCHLRRILRRLIRPDRATIVHVPIPVSPRTPSGIFGLGVPVVFGPMNGGMAFPPGYGDMTPALAGAVFRLGRFGSGLVNRLVPGKRQAAALLVANRRTAKALPAGGPDPVMLPENGVDPDLWTPAGAAARRRGAGDAFRLVFMGRMVDWKATDITVRAVHAARRRGLDVRLDLLGDGPERAAVLALVRDLGLTGAVAFHGFLPQADCARHLAGADALILNSVFECGGAVVLEAMATGLPVIGPDWGGPADYLDPTCGRLVSPVPRAAFAERLADAIAELAGDADLCRRLGAAGRAKVLRDYDWNRKVDRILEIYASVLAPPAPGGDAAG